MVALRVIRALVVSSLIGGCVSRPDVPWGDLGDAGVGCDDAISQVTTADGGTLAAFVSHDCWVLLAHYGAGARHVSYDPAIAQVMDTDDGEPAAPGWAPLPETGDSGHVAFATLNPAGRGLRLECGVDFATRLSFESADLFSDFSSGPRGTVAANGDPGWAMVAAVGSGEGRSSHANCGENTTNLSGGIAFCNGPGVPASFENHLASYTTTGPDLSGSPNVGCDGAGCDGPSCNLQFWVWLHL